MFFFNFDLIVATPGRLVDLLRVKKLSLSKVTYFVLDEADKLLQPGLKSQVELISDSIRPDRQTLLFSATFPGELQNSIRYFMKCLSEKALMVQVGESPNLSKETTGLSKISHTITQRVDVCVPHKRPRKLIRYLEKLRLDEKSKRQKSAVLVFVNQIATVNYLVKFLRKNNFSVSGLSGKMKQTDRESTLLDFRSGKNQILVATDVASRGLHINNLPIVINYDFPSNIPQYIHRVGRAGRNGVNGFALSFFTRNFSALAQDLITFLEQHNQIVDKTLRLLGNSNDDE